uniref:SH3 domain-containing protein n=1 Tax=Eptatretus burgeri TaxID=7764 RepID=A0A8C4R8R1_EPTBU
MTALQTQWSWMIQLCRCIDTQLQENTNYQQFFNDSAGVEDELKSRYECIRERYSCDKSTSIMKLESLLQEALAEKEKFVEYKRTVLNLASRAKHVVQLKPRSLAHPVQESLPIITLCEFKTDEVTLQRDDHCILKDNSQRIKWRVVGPGGCTINPLSICFIIPPLNKEALDFANRIEHLYDAVTSLWFHVILCLRCVLSWRCLLRDMEIIRSWSLQQPPCSSKYERLIATMDRCYETFITTSQESRLFTNAELAQVRQEYAQCMEFGDGLHRRHEEQSACSGSPAFLVTATPQPGICTPDAHMTRTGHDTHTELARQVTRLEEQLVELVQLPLRDHNPVGHSEERLALYQKLHSDLGEMQMQVEAFAQQCTRCMENHSCGSVANHTANHASNQSNICNLQQRLNHVRRLAASCHDHLRAVDSLVRSVTDVEALVLLYEGRLADSISAPSHTAGLHSYIALLKQWLSEMEQKRRALRRSLEEAQLAETSARRLQSLGVNCSDAYAFGKGAGLLAERWQQALDQLRFRLREVERLCRLLRPYRQSYGWLIEWLAQAAGHQQRIQAAPAPDSKSLAVQLTQQKALLSELEKNRAKVEECQHYAEICGDAAKEYETELQSFRAAVENFHHKPLLLRQQEALSEVVMKECADIRSRYGKMFSMMNQYSCCIGSKSGKLEEDEFLVEAGEIEVYLREIMDSLKRKYSCNKGTSITRLEVLLQEGKEEEGKIVRHHMPLDSFSSKVKTPAQKNVLNRLETLYQKLVELWKQQDSNLQSLLAWHKLQNTIHVIKTWSLPSIKQLRYEEQHHLLQELQCRHSALLRCSCNSEVIGKEDISLAEKDIETCQVHYQQLQQRLDQGKQEESLCKRSISRLHDVRRHLENLSEQAVQQLHLPLELGVHHELTCRIEKQERLGCEIDDLQEVMTEISRSVTEMDGQHMHNPMFLELQRDLNTTLQDLQDTSNLSAGCLQDLKNLKGIAQDCQESNVVLIGMENKLFENGHLPKDLQETENLCNCLKQLQVEVTEKEACFARLREHVKAGAGFTRRLLCQHGEQDENFERHIAMAWTLLQRWSGVHDQLRSRLRELERLYKLLEVYKPRAGTLLNWLNEATTQLDALQSTDSHDKLLNLKREIQSKQESVDECQRLAEQSCASLKDYEVILLTYRTLLEEHHPPRFWPKQVENPTDCIMQNYMDLRTRHTTLLGTLSQFLKFLTEAQKRDQEDQFFRAVQDVELSLRHTQQQLLHKYTCDLSTVPAHLEALLADRQDEDVFLEIQKNISHLSTKAQAPAERDTISRIDQLYNSTVQRWHELWTRLQAIQAWQVLRRDISLVQSWTVDSLKKLPPQQSEEQICHLEEHYRRLVRLGERTEVLEPGELCQAECDVTACCNHFRSLKASVNKEQKDEEACEASLQELRKIEVHTESIRKQAEQLVSLSLHDDHVQENVQRIKEHAVLCDEVQQIHSDLRCLVQSYNTLGTCYSYFALQTQLRFAEQRVVQLSSFVTLVTEELRAMDEVLKAIRATDELVWSYEKQLCEAALLPCETEALQELFNHLTRWQQQLVSRPDAFRTLQERLRLAGQLNERLSAVHGQLDPNLSQCIEEQQQLQERWCNLCKQTRTRLQHLEETLQLFHSYHSLHHQMVSWIEGVEIQLQQLQNLKGDDDQKLCSLQVQIEILRSEISQKQSKLDGLTMFEEQVLAAKKKYDAMLAQYRCSMDKSCGYSPPQKLQPSLETFHHELNNLQRRLSSLTTSVSELAARVLKAQHSQQGALAYKVHRVCRQVLVMVDGCELPLIEAFEKGLVSRERFMELASWQGEREEVEVVGDPATNGSADPGLCFGSHSPF